MNKYQEHLSDPWFAVAIVLFMNDGALRPKQGKY